MKLTQIPGEHDHANVQGPCDRCGTVLQRYRGQADIQCWKCGANYTCFGQRLRDDLRTRVNYSEYDEDLGDMEGNEESLLRREHG
jgi:hypothetical protein